MNIRCSLIHNDPTTVVTHSGSAYMQFAGRNPHGASAEHLSRFRKPSSPGIAWYVMTMITVIKTRYQILTTL